MSAQDDFQSRGHVERAASASGLADFLAARLAPLARPAVAVGSGRPDSYRGVHDASGLTDSQFADAVALYLARSRVSYADLAAAETLVPLFTRRFLRDVTLYPFRGNDGGPAIAVAEPPNEMVLRASAIVFGAPPEIRIASYEDLAQILTERLADEEQADEVVADDRSAASHDDLESLRDLASGAPVVRAVNDFLEKAMELRATDVHIEPFRNGLTVRMRVDGLLRAVPAPPLSMAQAIVSRVKILGG